MTITRASDLALGLQNRLNLLAQPVTSRFPSLGRQFGIRIQLSQHFRRVLRLKLMGKDTRPSSFPDVKRSAVLQTEGIDIIALLAVLKRLTEPRYFLISHSAPFTSALSDTGRHEHLAEFLARDQDHTVLYGKLLCRVREIVSK